MKNTLHIFSALFAALLLLGGCVPAHQINFSELNDLGEFKKLKIVFLDNTAVFGDSLHITADSARWSDSRTSLFSTVSTNSIKKIINTDYSRGAGAGAAYGILIGSAIGLGIGYKLDPPPYHGEYAGFGLALLILAGFLSGVITGAIIGGNIGYDIEYILK